MISIATGALADPAAISLLTLNRFLKRVGRVVGIVGEVDVLLASDAELRRLNRQFRGKNKATDVLSFPAETMPGLPATSRHAGDLAISLDTAARQAADHGHPLATELRVLLLHGLLHLAGMDHETDRGEMRDREAALRKELRLPTSLIERTLPIPAARQPSSGPSRHLPTAVLPNAKSRPPSAGVAAKRGGRQ